jgi:hypothetical protein
MTKPYRLTPEQWEAIELYADKTVFDACFLELRDRIEALEACDKEDANCWSAVRASMHALRDRIEQLEAGVTCPHVRSSDEGTSYCALAEAVAAQQPHQDKLDRLMALDADGGDPIVMPTSPAGSLVERVAELREKFEQLIKCSRAYDGYSTMTPVELADRLIDAVLKLEANR